MHISLILEKISELSTYNLVHIIAYLDFQYSIIIWKYLLYRNTNSLCTHKKSLWRFKSKRTLLNQRLVTLESHGNILAEIQFKFSEEKLLHLNPTILRVMSQAKLIGVPIFAISNDDDDDDAKATNGSGNIVEKFEVHITPTDSQNYNNLIAIEKDIDFSFELFNALWNILRYYQIPIHKMCFKGNSRQTVGSTNANKLHTKYASVRNWKKWGKRAKNLYNAV